MKQTSRLLLVPLTSALKEAFVESRETFGRALSAKLVEGWPQFPEAFQPSEVFDRNPAPWTGYIFVFDDDRMVIGNGGFVGLPGNTGGVEIGYEIAPQYWNRGFASEAAQAMMELAFEHGATSVTAHTLAEQNASNAVAKKIGMEFVEEVPNEEVGSVWRWRKVAPAR